MATDWSKFCVGLSPMNALYIGKGHIGQNGVFKLKERSEDRTEDILKTIMLKMQKDCDKREDGRSYVGYKAPNGATLLYIKPGYEFRVMKSANPKWKVDLPEEEDDD